MRASWIVAAALAAAACGPREDSGWRRGAESGPPDPATLDADRDGVPASVDCDDGDPTVYWLVSAYVDADGDGSGAGLQQETCAGGSLRSGWSYDGSDCDDHDPAHWASIPAYADEDLDGMGAGPEQILCTAGGALPVGWSQLSGDCALSDGTRWRVLAYEYRDADGDLFHAWSAGIVCAGAALPPGYANTGDPAVLGEDCDDSNPATWRAAFAWPDADGDGAPEGDESMLCIGEALPGGWVTTSLDRDCAPGDSARWQQWGYDGVDRDGDGSTVAEPGILCAGASLPDPYRVPLTGSDCDDADPARWELLTVFVDGDGDGLGAGSPLELCAGASLPPGLVAIEGDCAPLDPATWTTLQFAYRDADGDGKTVPQAGGVCAGAALPSGYSSVASGADCDDANREVWASVTGFVDADGDGVGAEAALEFCTTGAVPIGHAAAGGDCSPADPARWRLAAYAGVDRDGDGATAKEPGEVCTGERLPDPYRVTLAGNDCDDADPLRYRWVVVYRDEDGDGIGAGPRDIPCLGPELPAGWSIFGFDPNDASSAITSGEHDDALILLEL